MTNQIRDKFREYEGIKKAINLKGSRQKKRKWDLDDFDNGLADFREDRVGVSDILQVGSKVVIGGGLGLLAGVATIAVVASAAEVVVAGVVTKIAGAVGGAMGFTMGLNKVKKRKKKRLV